MSNIEFPIPKVYHTHHPVHPLLANHVHSFWTLDRDFGNGGLFEILPDSHIELAFGFERDSHGGTSRSAIHPRCGVLGLSNKPIAVNMHRRFTWVCAAFYAWGFYPLLGNDLDLREDISQSLEWRLPELTDQIENAVREDDLTLAVAHLQNFLLEQASHVRTATQEFEIAAHKLYQDHGTLRVETLAATANVSRRHLERRFQETLGVSPKAFGRRIRFQHMRDTLMLDPDPNLAALSYELGFADQAHLTREFRYFAERTPTQYLHQMHRQRQANPVAFLQDN